MRRRLEKLAEFLQRLLDSQVAAPSLSLFLSLSHPPAPGPPTSCPCFSSYSSSFLPSLHSSSSSGGGHRGEAGSAEAAAEHVQQGLGEDEEYEEQEEWTKLE